MYTRVKSIAKWVATSFFVVFLASCSGDFNPESADNTPVQGGENGGGSGGGTGGGNDDGGVIDPATGTWENKDEDGDGVLDVDDDYPFDPDKSFYFTLQESEENNVIEEANSIESGIPFRVKGSLSSLADTDTFRFQITDDIVNNKERISFYILAKGNAFRPTANLFNANGDSLDTFVPEYSKASGIFKYHFVYLPQDSGEVFLSVSSLFQNRSYNYELVAVIDSDSDGVADSKEFALGSDPVNRDSDSDSITDAYEIYVQDINGQILPDFDVDGIPNYLDQDSDGDGILDNAEGFKDLDGDLNGNFVDLDADGNELVDSSEAVDLSRPIDSDNDGIPDYKDLDDDNDHILDIFDGSRLTVVDEPDLFDESRISLNSLTTDIGKGTKLSFQALRGKHSVLNGGFESNKQYIVSVFLDGELFNYKISTDNHGQISFEMPTSIKAQFGTKKAEIFVYDNADKRTNSIIVEVLDPQAPIINSVDKEKYAAGEKVIVTGWNITPQTIALLGEEEYPLEEIIDSETASFIIPGFTSSMELRLKNGWGASNILRLNIINRVKALVTLPSEIEFDDKVYVLNSEGEYVEITVDEQTEVELPAISGSLISIKLNRNGEYVSFLKAEPGNASVNEVNIATTNYIWVKNTVGGISFEDMINSAAYAELESFVIDKLKSNIYYFAFDDTDELLDYTNKIKQLFMDNSRIKKRIKQRQLRTGASYSKKADDRELEATIIPGETDDIEVTELSRFFSFDGAIWNLNSYFDSENYGYVNLNNDTQLYLSRAVYKRRPDKSIESDPATGVDFDGNAKTYKHIKSLGDKDIVEPAVLSFLGYEFFDKDESLRVCRFDDCRVEVITPGFDQPELLTSNAETDIAFQLKVRTILERGVWSFIKAGLGASGLFDKDKLKKIRVDLLVDVIEKYYPDVFNAIENLNSNGSLSSNLVEVLHSTSKAMIDAEVEEIKKGGFGPLTKTLLAWTLGDDKFSPKDLTKKALTSLVERIITERLPAALLAAAADRATLAIPVVGQLKGIKEIAEFLDGVGQGIGTWVDLYTVRSKIEFDVAWGVNIFRLKPPIVSKDGGDAVINVEGSGFCIEERWYWTDIYPEFEFYDIADSTYRVSAKKPNVTDFDSDCRTVRITVSEDWLKQFVDGGRTKIGVHVEHRDDKADSQGIPALNKPKSNPPFILVGEGVQIGGVNPNPVYRGQLAEVYAIGISQKLKDNRIFISSSDGGFTEATIESIVDENTLKIIIPDDAVDGSIILEVDVESSNGAIETFRSPPFELNVIESYITIRYGDNGKLKDDQFALYFNDGEISKTTQGQVVKEHRLELVPGDYTLVFKGLKAPDKIATYYVCFSSNVTVLSGDSGGRVKTDATDNDNGLFTNMIRFRIDSGNGSLIEDCDQSLKMKSKIFYED